jgi:dihydroneopterin aldolase
MLFIHLHDVVFHSKHGLYEEEKVKGGEFVVNLSAGLKAKFVNALIDTVDYVCVYELVKKRMDEPTSLLETIVIDIAQQILAQFSIVEEVHISIKKLRPPITGFKGSVGVSYYLKREDTK